jgi:hypothetical protein
LSCALVMAIFQRKGKQAKPTTGEDANRSDAGSSGGAEKKPFAQRKPASKYGGMYMGYVISILSVFVCFATTDTAFKQQRLKAWQPILTPKTVLPTFFLVGLIFAPIGAVLYYYASQVTEFTLDYTKCKDQSSTLTTMPSSAYDYQTVVRVARVALSRDYLF